MMKIIKQIIPLFILLFLTTGCFKKIVEEKKNITDNYSKSIQNIKSEGFRIVIVSCAKIQKYKEQNVWEHISKNIKPDLLLIVGDIVYLDKKHRRKNLLSSLTPMEKIFKRQWDEKHFKKLINEVPYFAIWDDHDAGTNNITPKDTTSSKEAMFQEARNSFIKRIFNKEKVELYTRIKQFKIGNKIVDIKAKASLFEDGSSLDYSFEVGNVQFIMLDGISSRSKKNILTDEQFKLLEGKLKYYNGLTILSTGSSLELGDKKWRWNGTRYKNDYERLKKILNGKRVIVLTGDIHENATIQPGNKTTFYELVSSGIAIGDVKGNYLVLDIENISSHNSWNINFQHYGNNMNKYNPLENGKIQFQ